MGAHLHDRPFALINGDVLFAKTILQRLLDASGDIAVAVDRCAAVEHEEMKVLLDQRRVIGIGKGLDPSAAAGEYIGLAKFTTHGGELFLRAVEATIQSEGPNVFYEAALRRLLREGERIEAIDISGEPWIEIDYPHDLHDAGRTILQRIEEAERKEQGGAPRPIGSGEGRGDIMAQDSTRPSSPISVPRRRCG